VLVESASAFDRDGRSLRGKIEGSHQQLSGETSPKAAFNYSEVFNDTFGVALGVNYQKRTFESDNTEVEYDGEDDAAPGDVTAINLQHRKYEIERKRIGANLNLDWRPNEDSKYYLRTLYSQFDDAETRQRVIFNFDDAKMVGPAPTSTAWMACRRIRSTSACATAPRRKTPSRPASVARTS
jgi:hypothetical protein